MSAPVAPTSFSAHRRLLIAISLGLAVLTATAFAGVVRCEFVSWDDAGYVYENPQVLAGINAESICWAFTTIFADNWHPLTWISLQLDAQLFGLNPAAFHVTNLLLHTANVVLLFLVLHGMTGTVWRSAIVAALFAVHPLHVESVAWIAERKDVLSTLFWLLAMAAYWHYARRPGLWRYLLVFVTLALGLMAKPMLVTLPCVFCLLDWWPLRRLSGGVTRSSSEESDSQCPPVRLRFLVWEKVPLFLLVAVDSMLVHAAQFCAQRDSSLAARVANALTSYVIYLGQTFCPVGLCPYYPLATSSAPWWQALAIVLFLMAVSFAVVWQIRRRPYLAVGWFWYLGTLVPVIGLIQVGMQAHADRYTYVPLLGIFIMLAWGMPELCARLQRPAAVLAPLTALALAACAVCTHRQVEYWRTSRSLWERAVAIHPLDALSHVRLSGVEACSGRWDEAVANGRAATLLEPENISYKYRLIALLREAGQNEEADRELLLTANKLTQR